jgi:hypothetical protein
VNIGFELKIGARVRSLSRFGEQVVGGGIRSGPIEQVAAKFLIAREQVRKGRRRRVSEQGFGFLGLAVPKAHFGTLEAESPVPLRSWLVFEFRVPEFGGLTSALQIAVFVLGTRAFKENGWITSSYKRRLRNTTKK